MGNIKLYTEKQVKKAIELAQEMDKVPYTDNDYTHRHNEQNIIQSLAPIELPSDDEIGIQLGAEASDFPTYELADEYIDGFDNGAKWVIEQIKQQDNGQ